MDKNQFRKFLQKSVLNSFFTFNDKLFKQIEGLGMGIPLLLGPFMSFFIFMSFYEQQWLVDCPVDFKLAFYRRMTRSFYFITETTIGNFLLTLMKSIVILNSLWSPKNKILLFFGCSLLVCGSNSSFGTSVYRKESFTGLGKSFFRYCPFNFKINSIKTLIQRVYYIFSNNLHLHNEFNFLFGLFHQQWLSF